MRLFLHLMFLTFLAFAFSPASPAFAAIDVGVDSVWNDASPQAAEPDDVTREIKLLTGSYGIHSELLQAQADIPDLFTVTFWRPPRNENGLPA